MLSDALSHALNQLLATDPSTAEKYRELEGKILTLTCTLPFPITLQCTVKHNNIVILIGDKEETHARIKGSPLQLFRVGILQASSDALQVDDLIIEGDMELANSWLRLLRQANIDVEEYLSTWIGDIPAHTAQQAFSRLKKSIANNIASLTTSMEEYLHEESDWFPTRDALNTFLHEVDTLREDTDRLAAKITLLKQHLKDYP